MNSNYYLTLLYKKSLELKKILSTIDEKGYSSEYKKYLISSYIITLDSILEIGIGDLHSPKLDELTSLIYYTRQKAVHYGYFNGMHNVENIATKIIELTEENYKNELEYYKKLFNSDNFYCASNLVIKNSSQIQLDTYFYKLKSKDNNQVLCVPLRKMFSLTSTSKDKVIEYIVDTSDPLSLYSYEEGGRVGNHTLLYMEQAKEFIKENFEIVNEDYNEHNNEMMKIISSFISDPVNSNQIMEYASHDTFCRNTIDVIKDFIEERTMLKAYLDSNHLIKDKYTVSKSQKADYVKLQNKFKKSALPFITQRDAFFIDMTIKRATFYRNTLIGDITSGLIIDDAVLCPILIQLYETGPKYFSNQFKNSSPEFKKCCENLLKYRIIFSHYLLNTKEYKENLQNFKEEFTKLIQMISMINTDDVRIPVSENYDTYRLIERDKSEFFNYKHEQFLHIKGNTYIGKKIYYSSRNSESKNLIAIIPSNDSCVSYYEKDANGYLNIKYTIDEKTGKKKPIHNLSSSLRGSKEVSIDFNLSNLFKAYSMLKRIKSNGDIYIGFNSCEENNKIAHYDDLDNVILRFYNQGYLPVELLQPTKLSTTNYENTGIVHLLDNKDNVIATIVNKKKCKFNFESKKDEKRFFSRIDDITHDFSRRRHNR